MPPPRSRIVAIAIAQAMFTASISSAQQLPPGFTATTLAATPDGIAYATSMCIAPDGRVFIGLQSGEIKIWKDGVGVLPAPFHTFAVENTAEAGLIGMTLDPDFAHNGFIYVQYNAPTTSPHRVSRITTSTSNPDVAEPDSEFVLLEIQHSFSAAHNAGGIRFGPDGKLYVAIGDKGTQSSQSLNTLLGKILRLNPDGTIPDDNPTSFNGVEGSTTGIHRAIWAIGLRNPFRFAFHPENGRMFINDVGTSIWEEINEGAPGRNYGYPATEGNFDPANFPGFTRPLATFMQSSAQFQGSAILAGVFYNPSVCSFPSEYFGCYFYSTYVHGTYRLNPDSGATQLFASLAAGSLDSQVDNRGRLLLLRPFSTPARLLTRIEYTDPLPPVVVRQPGPQILCNGDAATLSLVVSASLPVTYQWKRNGIPIDDVLGISGSQARELNIDSLQPGHAGEYACIIQNAYGETQTNSVVVGVGPATSGYNGDFIHDFVRALIVQSTEYVDLCRFDFDASGSVDPADVNPFVAATLAG